MFMVVFLSALTNGLGASVSAQIAKYGPLTYVLSTDSEGVIPYSSITADDIEALEAAGMRNYASLVIQRATITRVDDSNTLDITYFATDHNESNTLEPTLIDSDLAISELGDNEVILDSAFENEGIHVGDRVIDKMSEQELTVVAFAKRANYGYSNIGFVSSQTFAPMGSVIGCKQFSCSGDAVWRLIMGCRRMLGAWDRAAIMAGVDVGLSQVRIAHLIGRSPSVVCREIARHTGPDGQYRAEEADKAARAARRRPKKRLLDCDEVLRDRVIADLSRACSIVCVSVFLFERIDA